MGAWAPDVGGVRTFGGERASEDGGRGLEAREIIIQSPADFSFTKCLGFIAKSNKLSTN